MLTSDIMAMDQNQFEQALEAVLSRVLNEKRAIDDEQHREDHEFTQMLKKRWKKREAMWEKFRLSVIGSFAVICVGGLVWLGEWIVDFIKSLQSNS